MISKINKYRDEFYYLNIADFNLQLIFHKHERINLRIKIINDILSTFTGFILKERPKNIDYIVEFVVNERAHIFYDSKTLKNFISFYEKETKRKLTTYYQISIFQIQIILINILHKLLAKNNGFLLHASANEIENQATLFLGDHGSGKSTIMKILSSKFRALADDSIILKKEKKEFYLYQTPFIEKENWFKRNYDKHKINNIFFLTKSSFYKIEKVTNQDKIIKNILKVFWVLDKKHSYQLSHVLEFLLNFNHFYNLYFGLDKKQVLKLFTNLKRNVF